MLTPRSTGIEQWSSPSTLAKCASHWPVGPLGGKHGLPKPGNLSNCINDLTQHGEFETEGAWCSTLYTVMLKPLAPMAISSILWYQGENNVCKEEWDGTNNASYCPPTTGAEFYNCAMKALITDWRALFQPAQYAASEPELPFLQAMLDGFASCSCTRHDPCVPPQPDVCDNCRPTSNFATIRAAQAAAAAATNSTLVVNFDLGTLNSASARIHSPRKAPLAARFHRHLSNLLYGRAVVTTGPILLNASATNVARDGSSTVALRFNGSGVSGLHLHGTAGCIGGYNFSTGKHGAPIVGFRCCDTSPFFVRFSTRAEWVRHPANSTVIRGQTVTLLNVVPPSSATSGEEAAIVVGLRYAWEAYPNCGLYNGAEPTTGPVAGGDSVYGGIEPGCNRKPGPGDSWSGIAPECVYVGDSLPASPFEVALPFTGSMRRVGDR